MGLTGVRSGSKAKDPKSRSVHKLEKKLNFINKVQDTVAQNSKSKVVRKKKLSKRQRKLKAYDLSDLSEFLPDLESLPTKTSVTKDERINCKSRQTLVQRESARMQAVLKDPSFMKDPFEAIHKRLLETQPPLQEGHKISPKGKKKGKKKKAKKENSANDMEI